MQALSEMTNINWLVLGWNGRAYNGIFFNNPIGWILSHINSNFALFKSNGITNFKKIVIAIRPDSRDAKELIKITNQLCNYYKTNFSLLQLIEKDSDEKTKNLITSKAQKLLKNTNGKLMLISSSDPIGTVSEITADFDLLILGTPRKDTWMTMLFGTGTDKFAVNSTCSVLRLTIKKDN